VYDSINNTVDIYDLYLQGSGLKLYAVEQRKKYIASLFDGEVAVNDFKAHLCAFGLPTNKDYKTFDIPFTDDTKQSNNDELKKILMSKIIEIKTQPHKETWQSLLSNATLVYQDLENRGVLFESMLVHPIYGTNTFTGRSSTSDFNIQGMGDGQDITSVSYDNDIFVYADWIAADMRMASIMSNDIEMQKAFELSDPYEYLATKINTDVTRDECKKALLSSIYALNYDNTILDLYPQLKNWIISSCEKLEIDKYLSSILGRKFHLNKNNHRSVFNATIQGSVAHAMQNVLIKLHQKMPELILTEMHDSVILCCRKDLLKKTVEFVKDTMLHPFNGIIDSNPLFPLRVSIGNKWRNWKLFKTYR
jgi:hypothetical protein